MLQKIFPAFGTVNSVTLYGSFDPETAQQVKKRAMELHSLFSFFEPGSDIFRLNEQAGTEPVPVRQDTLFVLTHALDYGRETQGTFAPLFSYREIPCFRRDIFSSILTAYKNAGGEIELHQAPAEMMNRGKSVPGGACGFWGACGAGISTGMFVSIISKSTPLSVEPFGLSHLMTAKALEQIGSCGS